MGCDMDKKYTVSLDIGTHSVGWAVLDGFDLVKKFKRITEIEDGEVKGKRKQGTNLWGAYTFEEAQTAEGRRGKRAMRRRILRRKNRLINLMNIFENEILQFDEGFFERLEESKLQKDGALGLPKHDYPLFGNIKSPTGESFENQKEYYEKYPTIYHLRERLMNDNTKADLRLIYLALSHILKYRGHFVNEGNEFSLENIDVKSNWGRLIEVYSPIFGIEFDEDKIDDVESILKNRGLSRSKKAFDLGKLYDVVEVDQNFERHDRGGAKETKKFLEGKNKQLKALFDAVVGNGIRLHDIFDNADYNNKNNPEMPKSSEFKFGMDIEKYEDMLTKLGLSEEEHEILEIGKQVYESIVLCNILTKESLSASMIDKFETHKKQLKELKVHVAQNCDKDTHLKIFGDTGIYTRYVNHKSVQKSLTREEFYKEFEKLLPGYKKEEIELDNFLPKQRISDNGSIPYQIHEHELLKIIDNQGKHYPFLLENKDKLNALIKFRIPYYIGPLTTNHDNKKGGSNFAWLIKQSGKENEPITPYNFKDVVDSEASNSQFIERMTAFCTYFPKEKVMPDKSLTYQEFKIYNELMICGYEEAGSKRTYFSPEMRKLIVDNLFKKHKKVNAKQVAELLYNETNIELAAEQFFGIDGLSFNASYSTYIDLVKRVKLSDDFIEKHKPKLEQIIKWATIFKDREMMKKTITIANNNEWNGVFDSGQIKELAKLKYTGWGRLSQKLLTGTACDDGRSILDNLRDGKYKNFMRLLEDKNVKEKIEQARVEVMKDGTLGRDFVDGLAGSPAVKKGIGQSLKIIKELERVLGKKNISRIVIEMAREDGEKGKRTISRRKQIEKMYENYSGESFQREFKDTSEGDFENNERLFLYFLQNCKCMYTGTKLEIDNLSNYEIDHIIPQSYKDDNSLDNKVLVLKNANQNKSDDVPNEAIVRKMSAFWHMLEKNGQISASKLKNLKIGKLSDEVKEGFINRQLVETRQITKHVVSILTNHYKGTQIEVMTPRAGLTSQFRYGFQKCKKWKCKEECTCGHEGWKFPKNREINDHHHAHDAYLNAIVANYIYNARPDLKRLWVYGEYLKNNKDEGGRAKGDKFVRQILSGMIESDWVNQATNESFANKDTIIAKVQKTLGYRNVNVVKKTEINSGEFGKETIFKAGKDLMPIKRDLDPEKYGGMKTSPKSSAFAVVVRNNKNEIIAVDVRVIDMQNYAKLSKDEKLAFLQSNNKKLGIKEIIVDVVQKYTIFRMQNGIYRQIKSFQESGPASQVKTTFDLNTSPLELYDALCKYISDNALFKEDKVALLTSKMRENFITANDEVKKKVVKELSNVTKGSNQGLASLSSIGLGTTAQQLKSGNLITNGATLIYQSPTGLYETRKKI